jgi:hypothetical protein
MVRERSGGTSMVRERRDSAATEADLLWRCRAVGVEADTLRCRRGKGAARRR